MDSWEERLTSGRLRLRDKSRRRFARQARAGWIKAAVLALLFGTIAVAAFMAVTGWPWAGR